MTIDSAEKYFLKNNLSLIAQKYEIEEAKAAVIQARLFENPDLTYSNTIHNPQNGKYFDLSSQSDHTIQINQLFYLAGKRKKRTKVEEINTQMNEYQYYDMVRTLKNELHTAFYDLHYLLQALEMYNRQLMSAKKIADLVDDQSKKGNLSLREVTRIKALVFSLENGKLNVLNEIMDRENSLKVLTRLPAQNFIIPTVDDSKTENLSMTTVNLQQILSVADTARYDLKQAELAIKHEEANYALQKALAVPDVTFGPGYTQQSNFVKDDLTYAVGFAIPIFNRNQGNILAAKNLVDERKAQYDQAKEGIHNDVVAAYTKAVESEKIYKNFDQSFTKDYDKLISGITLEYEKRNVSLLEFLDYYQTYTQSMSDLFQLRSARMEAIENINLVTGTTIIK
ncbi:MAG TPA: TolC family protein [Bacteroidia bacterium]